jgi:hypothetical protein
MVIYSHDNGDMLPTFDETGPRVQLSISPEWSFPYVDCEEVRT